MTVTLSSNILKEILIITFIVTIMMVIKRMGGAIDTRTPWSSSAKIIKSFKTTFSSSHRGVRYAKSLLIQYFIDIDILQNSLIDIDIFKNDLIGIDIDIDTFKNGHIDRDIYTSQRFLINIYNDKDLFKISLLIFSSIWICSNFSSLYFVDVDILKRIVDISLIF